MTLLTTFNSSSGSTVCVSGLISVGKSAFIRQLAEACSSLNLRCHTMPELLCPSLCEQLPRNPSLFDAFMFGHRIQMNIDAKQIARSIDLVIMERCFIDHLAFLTAIDHVGWASKEYTDWCRKIAVEMAPPIPDYFIYLDVSAATAYERMRERAEPRDANFTIEFFDALRGAYLHTIDMYHKEPIILDWNEFGRDFEVNDLLICG